MYDLQYLLSPSFQVLGVSGKPLVGGWIEVFLHNDHSESGKVITRFTFDDDVSYPYNEFQVKLDSMGMATIIVETGKSYDVFCYDSFGAPRWSRENVDKTLFSADYPIVIDIENDRIYIAEHGIGRNLLKNAHNLVPDTRYLKFTDFNGKVVVSLCDDLQTFLANLGGGGYNP